MNGRKILAVAAGVLIVGAAAGAIALKVLLTPERLRTTVVRATERSTGFDVELRSARLSLFPFGVTLEGLTADDPGSTTSIALESGLVRMRLLPVLSRRLVVSTIELDAPRLDLEQRETGVVLPAALGALANTTGPAPGEETVPPADDRADWNLEGKVDSFRITRGALFLRDAGRGDTLAVEGIDLDGTVALEERGARITSAGTIRLEALEAPALAPFREALASRKPELRYDVAYLPRTGVLEVAAAELSAGPLRARITGRVTGLPDAPVASLSLEPEPLELAELLPLVPKESLPPDLTLRAQGKLAVAASIDGPLGDPEHPPAIDARIDWTDVSLGAGEVEHRLSMKSGGLVIDGETATLKTTRATIGRSDFELDGKMTGLTGERFLTLSAKSRVLDLAELTPTLERLFPTGASARRAAGGVPAGAPAGGSVSPGAAPPGVLLPPLPPMDADVTLAIDSLITPTSRLSGVKVTENVRAGRGTIDATSAGADFDGLTLQRLTAQGVATATGLEGTFRAPTAHAHRVPLSEVAGRLVLGTDAVMRFRDVTGALFGGRIEGSADLDVTDPDKPRFRLETRARGLEANAFLSTLTPVRDLLFGTLDLESKFEGAGSLPEEVARSLAGAGSAKTTAGRVQVSPMVTAVWNALDLGGRGDAIDFRDLVTTFRVEDGKVHTRDLAITGRNGDWSVNGSAGFDGTVDYRVVLLLSEELSSLYRKKMGADLAKLFANAKGRMAVDLSIRGQAAKPKVQVDVDALAKRARENWKGELKPELRDKLEEGLRDGLGGLLSGSKARADSSDSATVRPGAEQAVDKVLQGLFGKKKKGS